MADSTLRKWLAIIRIGTGAVFIYNALPKFSTLYLQTFKSDLYTCLENNPFPWFQSFLKAVVIPNEQVAANLLLGAEVITGAFLILGLLTGIAALLGLGLSACFVLATSHISLGAMQFGPDAWISPNIYTLMVLLLIFVARAGRTWGLDSKVGSSKGWLW